MFKNTQKNKGYTLLFAVMVSSLVLAVGISILNISKKEFLLSSSARESITAFYAADSALECAVYFDNIGYFSDINSASLIKCVGNTISNISNNLPATISYDIKLKPVGEAGSQENAICARVVRNYDSTTRVVEFISRGYNMGWKVNGNSGRCDTPSPRRVERALRYIFSI